MQQFLVPQFLDVEPKILGPVTVRQFIIMMSCLLVLVIEYKLADFGLFLIFGIITVALFAIFAFVRVNGRPFQYFLLSLTQTLQRPRLRLWNKELTVKQLRLLLKEEQKGRVAAPVLLKTPKRITASRLKELSLLVNTGGAYHPEEEMFQDNF